VRAFVLALVALCLTGCAGTKFNFGYDFQAKRFFASWKLPLSAALKSEASGNGSEDSGYGHQKVAHR
jgi:hypothetical protein